MVINVFILVTIVVIVFEILVHVLTKKSLIVVRTPTTNVLMLFQVFTKNDLMEVHVLTKKFLIAVRIPMKKFLMLFHVSTKNVLMEVQTSSQLVPNHPSITFAVFFNVFTMVVKNDTI